MTPLAFVDTETTGLDPERHEIWEVGLILRRESASNEVFDEEHHWMLQPNNLELADPMALSIGQFHERFDREAAAPSITAFCNEFARLTSGAHLVGAVVSFDAIRLERLLRRHGQCPSWHYHLIDVEALAVGWLASQTTHMVAAHDPLVKLPWNSTEISRACGVDPDAFDKHTAMGDAQWARAIYDRVMGVTVI